MSFNHIGNYVCECGKTFNSSQSFNGHKSNCKVHHLSKYGDLTFITDKYVRVSNSCRTTHKAKFSKLEQEKLEQWISEQHTCEKCGKIMTEKFGSGRFCSRQCANSRERTDEIKNKIKESVSLTSNEKHKTFVDDYYKNPSHCKICNTILDYDHRRKKTCSEHCKRLLASMNLKNNPNAGGIRDGAGIGKKGWYKGYFCDSTYELVYVIYNLDHNIEFKRNKNFYPYTYRGKVKKYYPDFELVDKSLVEIKGYHTEQVDAKISAVTDRPIKILYQEDLQFAFDWVKEHYDYKNLEDLYESK